MTIWPELLHCIVGCLRRSCCRLQ